MRRAFTLIELLVVIAVLALLIALLLPAVGSMRLSGWRTVSSANLHNIVVAGFVYQDSQKGYLPCFPAFQERGMMPEFYPGTTTRIPLSAYCTWTFGGKNPRGFWAGTAQGFFDVEAADRPLNAFLTDSAIWAPPIPETLPANADERKTLQIPVFRDPSDKRGHQRNWPNPNVASVQEGDIATCYDDVGTSYQFNVKWFDQLCLPQTPQQVLGSQIAMQKWYQGLRRLRAADAFTPSRFAWIHDEYADITVYNTNPLVQVRNGYKDFNKSMMGYMDGHVAYTKLRPGGQLTPEDDNSFINSDYQFVFLDLRQ